MSYVSCQKHADAINDLQSQIDGMDDTLRQDLASTATGKGGALVGFKQLGTGAVARTTLDKMRESVSVKDFGAVCDGVTVDTAALVAADAYCTANGKTLLIEGTPLIDQSLAFLNKSSWSFAGGNGVTGSDYPQSYLIKKSTVTGPLLIFERDGVVLDGLAIVGQPGNTDNGVDLRGNSPLLIRPFVTGCGQDGIRIGSDNASGDNTNKFHLIGPRCVSNGRDGIHVHSAQIDANAGLIDHPICNNNTRHGIYGGKAALGVTILTPVCESNAGYGLYTTAEWGYIGSNIVVGGDIEANTAGNVYEAVVGQTLFYGVSVQGKVWDNTTNIRSFTPAITGASSAGTCTYTQQKGSYQIVGSVVHFQIHLAWTGHTGSGQAYINLPVAAYASNPVQQFIPVDVVSSGITLASGAQYQLIINTAGNRLQAYQTNAGVLGALSVGASGELYISGSYPRALPVFFSY